MVKKLLILCLLALIHLTCFSQTNITIANQSNNVDSLKSLMEIFDRDCFKMEISFNGYESSSDESFYYDSLFVIRAYHLSWNMEGNSGETYYWFESVGLSASYDENQGQEGEPETTFLKLPADSNKLKESELQLNTRVRNILNLIDENQSLKTENNGSVIIGIEESKNYGMEFTETTKIFIDKTLYKHLFDSE